MKIIKNYMYNLTYQIFIILIPLVTVPYVSRTIGAEGIGLNAYTNSLMSYFVLLANVGLTLYGNRTIAYTRDSIEERSRRFWEIVILKVIMTIVSFVCLYGFMRAYNQYTVLLAVQSIQLISVAFDISWFFVGIEDFKKTVTRNIMVKILSLVLIFSFVHDANDLVLYILILTCSTLFGNLTLWTYIRKYITKVSPSTFQFKMHIVPVMLLFLPQLATSFFVSINRIMLGNFSTLVQTGYFDNADKMVRIFLAFITAIGTVMFPRIANSFNRQEYEKVKTYLTTAFDAVNLMSFPIVFGLITVATPFSNIFFGANFEGIDKVLAILAIELIFMGWSSIIGQQYLVAVNKVQGLTVSLLISLVVTLFNGYFLISHFGAMGAAVSSVVAEAIIAFVQLIYLKRYLKSVELFSGLWKIFLSSIVMMICSGWVGSFIGNDFIHIVVSVLVGAMTYVGMILLLKPRILLNGKELISSMRKK